MIRRVFAFPYVKMRDVVRAHPQLLGTECFISILNCDRGQERLLPADSPTLLTLYFDDWTARMLATLPAGYDRPIVNITEGQADLIIDLLQAAQRRENTEEVLFINCAAGVSRSGAVATFVQEALRLDYEQFRRDNRNVLPNDIILKMLRTRWALRQQS